MMAVFPVKQLCALMHPFVIGILSFIIGLLSVHVISSDLAFPYLASVRLNNLARGMGLNPLSTTSQHQYEVQVVSQDPLILYIHNFLSRNEINHLLQAGEGRFETSKVYPGKDAYVNTKDRVSESAILEPDDITRRIKRRARRFRGWHGNNSTHIQELKLKRYGVNGFYTFHYDWDALTIEGNRVATFMVYIADDCTGGGTNFPKIERPVDGRWCSIIDCEDDEYPGTTFKPVAGSAVFWENIHANGSLNTAVRHAALPVRSGEKVGLNIWFWDADWRLPASDDRKFYL